MARGGARRRGEGRTASARRLPGPSADGIVSEDRRRPVPLRYRRGRDTARTHGLPRAARSRGNGRVASVERPAESWRGFHTQPYNRQRCKGRSGQHLGRGGSPVRPPLEAFVPEAKAVTSPNGNLTGFPYPCTLSAPGMDGAETCRILVGSTLGVVIVTVGTTPPSRSVAFRSG